MSVEIKSYTVKAIKGNAKGTAKAMLAVGLKIATQAKALAPVGDTGKLHNSYDAEQEGKDTVIVGTNTEYAPYVELGTRYQNPQPHLRPAVSIVVNGSEGKKAVTKAFNDYIGLEE